MKKQIKLAIIMSIVLSILGGCETKIEYERLVKDLDEGDMKSVMSASNDGYAHLEERVIHSTFEEKEDGIHKKNIYQTTDGVYNTKEKNLYGTTTQTVITEIDTRKEKDKIKDYKKEKIYSTNIKYENGQVQSTNLNPDVSQVKLLMDRLHGVGKLKMKPGDDKKGFDEPNSVGYDLTEAEFQQMINETLKLQYDEYDGASIVFNFNAAKDSKEQSMELLELSVYVDYKKKNEEGKMVTYMLQINTYFAGRKYNNQSALKDYENYKKQYGNNR
ncbi:DUF3952 domain-containing protein [Bacillus sp. Xin]|uniref:DUF3952 domain-containing protein n=1 Tax=unclassified Bacillus (in: firmicutes) TaxID=185979 RepID=UPI001573115D|nr:MULTISPECIES: DUF3952 domain-containing protein [unclassified Bacillus (in: firmicutes)]MBC6975016.1 DUF3952 domain-containing protein [Bacillus sp. Xin]NSW37748.1 DUF3952 domain-containing protein [Bacillus sp. Xin1]